MPRPMDPIRHDRRRRLLAANSAASAARAASNSVVTLILPLVLVVLLPPAKYGAWAVIFSIASYILYLDFGLQSTVSSMVGRSFDGKLTGRILAIGRSAIHVVLGVAILCLVTATGIALVIASVFPAIPTKLQAEAAIALPLLAFGQGLGLIGGVASSFEAGMQRTVHATAVTVPARLLSAVGVVIGALFNAPLPVIACLFSAPVVAGTGVLVHRVYRPRDPDEDDSGERPRPSELYRPLLGHAGPLAVWNVCVLVVSGVDLAVVGRLNFPAVPAYSIASSVALGIAGLDAALLNPLLPELARLHTSGLSAKFDNALLLVTRLNASFMLGAALLVAALFPALVSLAPGLEGGNAPALLLVLLAGNAVRLFLAPLSIAYVAVGAQRRLLWPPVVEATTNLACSIWLGVLLGAIGVAIGTLVGALVGAGLSLLWSLRVAALGGLRARQLVPSLLLWPVVPWMPLAVGLVAIWILNLPAWSLIWSASLLITGTLSALLALRDARRLLHRRFS